MAIWDACHSFGGPPSGMARESSGGSPPGPACLAGLGGLSLTDQAGGPHGIRCRSARRPGRPPAPPRAGRAPARRARADGAPSRRRRAARRAPRPAGSGPGRARARRTGRARWRRASGRRRWARAGCGPGDRGEVGEPHLELDRAPGHDRPARSRAAVRSHSRSSSRRTTSGSSTSRGEGLLGADALVGLVRDDAALVAAPGQRVQVGAGGLARAPDAGWRSGVFAMSPTVRSPSRSSSSSVFSPTPHSAATGSGCRKATTSAAGTTSMPVGLGPGRGELGDELGGGDPDRAGDALLVGDPVADQLRRSRPAAQPPHRAGDVEEGLVQRQRLDQRGDRAEDLHHPGARPRSSARGRAGRRWPAGTAAGPGPSASPSARRSAAPRRSPRGPRRATPPPTMTGVPRSSGRLDQLDRGVEGVHVDVQDGAAGVVPAVGPGRRAGPVQLLAAAHRSPLRGHRQARAARTCSWVATARNSRRPGGGRSRSSRAAAAGSASESAPGTRSAEAADAVDLPDRQPGGARAAPASSVSVNRRGSGSPGPHRPSGSSSAWRASREAPGDGPGEHDGVAVGGQHAERAAGAQHRGEGLDGGRGRRRRARARRGTGPGRPGRARPRRAAPPRRPAPRGPSHARLAGAALSEARASGLGSTTVTRWPSLGQRHGEPAGAAADVDHVERWPSWTGRSDERVAQHDVPHHGRARSARRPPRRDGRAADRHRRRWHGAALSASARTGRDAGPLTGPSCPGCECHSLRGACARSRPSLAGWPSRRVLAGRLDVGVGRLAEPARVHQHPPRPAMPPALDRPCRSPGSWPRRRVTGRVDRLTGRGRAAPAAPATAAR